MQTNESVAKQLLLSEYSIIIPSIPIADQSIPFMEINNSRFLVSIIPFQLSDVLELDCL